MVCKLNILITPSRQLCDHSKQQYQYNNTEHEHLRTQTRDKREGASPLSRKHYLEVKSMNADKVTQVKELEKYMNELTSDIVEMIQDASPEEKQLLHKKMQMLTSKIEQI